MVRVIAGRLLLGSAGDRVRASCKTSGATTPASASRPALDSARQIHYNDTVRALREIRTVVGLAILAFGSVFGLYYALGGWTWYVFAPLWLAGLIVLCLVDPATVLAGRDPPQRPRCRVRGLSVSLKAISRYRAGSWHRLVLWLRLLLQPGSHPAPRRETSTVKLTHYPAPSRPRSAQAGRLSEPAAARAASRHRATPAASRRSGRRWRGRSGSTVS